ncbi:hypothetical protein EGT07_10990 [Herbaspirillum sp. HC18]|nr:hypothetical protein EGT07_10990 [Herbaspirillum sp. HC18]
MKTNRLEREVLDWFAANAGRIEIAAQCRQVEVVARERTGPGIITTLRVDGSLPLSNIGCVPNAPLISSPLLPHGAGVDLWLKDGRLDQMEFVTFGGAIFPEGDFPFELVESL